MTEPPHPTLSRSSSQAAQLDAKSFERVAPLVKSELTRLLRVGELSVGDTLEQVFTQLFGADRPRQELVRFLVFASPLARRTAIELANLDDPVGDGIKVADVKLWMWWLDAMDPLSARMIDLHYFAGLSARETAAALDMPLGAVIRDLRMAKAWLQVKLEPELSTAGVPVVTPPPESRPQD